MLIYIKQRKEELMQENEGEEGVGDRKKLNLGAPTNAQSNSALSS